VSETPFADRIEADIEVLTARIVDALVARLPAYAAMGTDVLRDEVEPIARHTVELFLRYLRGGGLDPDTDLVRLRQAVARRAAERVPLDALVGAYQVGASVGWQAVVDAASPGDERHLLDLARDVMSFVEVVTSTVTTTYLDERQALYGEERDLRRALVEALVTGMPAEQPAQRARVTVRPTYIVLALEVEADDDEPADEPTGQSDVQRSRQRRLEEHLRSEGGEVLTLLAPGGGTVLVPVPDQQPAAETAAVVGQLVDGLAGSAGAPVRAGWTVAPAPGGVPMAAAEAREVLRLATALNHPPGAYAIDDVALEYLLTRPSDAGDRLQHVLAPLEQGPELLATLEAWFAADFDRRAAARALTIHPNTLDYRLRRVTELTGLTVTTARGLQLLGAAMTVHRLRNPA
jgi:hypothetical protein